MVSMVPRGEVPDLRAQVATTELLTLWQHEYESSLRGIPRAHPASVLALRHTSFTNRTRTKRRSGACGPRSSPSPISAEELSTVTGINRLSLEGESHEFLLTGSPTSEASWATMLQTELRRIDARFSVAAQSRRDGSASVRVIPAGTPLGKNPHPRGESITVLRPRLLRVDLSLGGLDITPDDPSSAPGTATAAARFGSLACSTHRAIRSRCSVSW